MTTPLPDRPLLRRHHRPWPMEGEVRDLVVTQGSIPDDLDGSLYRIGPNLRYAPLSGRYNGWMGDEIVATATPRWHYLHITQDVIPALQKHGVTDEQIDQMLVGNPRRIFETSGGY